MKSVLQDWVMCLGLRHQGVLLTAVRGCDTALKKDPSKMLTRCYRAAVLNCFCGDVKKAATFIEFCLPDEILKRMNNFRKNLDHYPMHYVAHLMHAAEIVGYKHPEPVGCYWKSFYFSMCNGLHLPHESEYELDKRLTLSEKDFKLKD